MAVTVGTSTWSSSQPLKSRSSTLLSSSTQLLQRQSTFCLFFFLTQAQIRGSDISHLPRQNMAYLAVLNSKIKNSMQEELFPTETHVLHSTQIVILKYRQSREFSTSPCIHKPGCPMTPTVTSPNQN